MVELTAENFDQKVKNSDAPVLVDLWASWCMPCKKLAPILEELEEEYSEKMLFGKVNVEDNKSVATKYGVRSIPTLLIFNNGEIVKKMVGMQSKDKLKSEIDQVT